jgi:hypothetical protein
MHRMKRNALVLTLSALLLALLTLLLSARLHLDVQLPLILLRQLNFLQLALKLFSKVFLFSSFLFRHHKTTFNYLQLLSRIIYSL